MLLIFISLAVQCQLKNEDEPKDDRVCGAELLLSHRVRLAVFSHTLIASLDGNLFSRSDGRKSEPPERW